MGLICSILNFLCSILLIIVSPFSFDHWLSLWYLQTFPNITVNIFKLIGEAVWYTLQSKYFRNIVTHPFLLGVLVLSVFFDFLFWCVLHIILFYCCCFCIRVGPFTLKITSNLATLSLSYTIIIGWL
jgi:hypothetical protein